MNETNPAAASTESGGATPPRIPPLHPLSVLTPARVNMTTWLWPDHRIGKRESRRLREEHNGSVNAVEIMRKVLTEIVEHPANTEAGHERQRLLAVAALELTVQS